MRLVLWAETDQGIGLESGIVQYTSTITVVLHSCVRVRECTTKPACKIVKSKNCLQNYRPVQKNRIAAELVHSLVVPHSCADSRATPRGTFSEP
jgi:hypothetical protein